MSGLQTNLEKLVLRLHRMAMRVADAVEACLEAIAYRDVEAGKRVDSEDSWIDREEVEIEQECVGLLALYQPAAIDLRQICCIIKVNSDLERIADIAARLGRRVKHIVIEEVRPQDFLHYESVVAATREIVGMTARMLNSTDDELPRMVIAADRQLDWAYAEFTREVLDAGRERLSLEAVLLMVLLARSLERIGDHCTNIAEDVFYFLTGEIIRHGNRKKPPAA